MQNFLLLGPARTALASAGIKSSFELLYADPQDLRAVPVSPDVSEMRFANPFVVRELAALKSRITAPALAQFESADVILQRQQQEARRSRGLFLSTGAQALDTLLGGGVRLGELTEVYGDSGVGKTQFCISVAMHAAAHGHTALYFDTLQSFCAEYAGQVAATTRSARCTETEALANVRVCCTFDPEALVDSLSLLATRLAQSKREEVRQEGQQQQQHGPLEPPADANTSPLSDTERRFFTRLRLIVVDSFAALLAPLVGFKHNPLGHALLMNLSHALKTLAQQYQLAVVCTNNAVLGGLKSDADGNEASATAAVTATAASAGEQKNAALGAAWTHEAATRLLLVVPSGSAEQPVYEGMARVRRRAVLVKSSTRPRGERQWFMLTPNGVADDSGFALQ